MAVFMAGATIKGFVGRGLSPLKLELVNSHARAIEVRRLSQIPDDNFARVFAESGAIKNTSAHFRSSMCNTGSPGPRNPPPTFRYDFHSSSSVKKSSSSKEKEGCSVLVVVLVVVELADDFLRSAIASSRRIYDSTS